MHVTLFEQNLTNELVDMHEHHPWMGTTDHIFTSISIIINYSSPADSWKLDTALMLFSITNSVLLITESFGKEL